MRDVVVDEYGYVQAWVWLSPERELEILRSEVVSQEGSMYKPVAEYFASHCTVVIEETSVDDEEWNWGGYERALHKEFRECPGDSIPHICAKRMEVKGNG